MRRIVNAMANKRWGELDPRVRRAIVVSGAFEAGLKVIALIDLARRPSQEIRGSKAKWIAAVALINSAGLVPVLYLLRGRRRQQLRPGDNVASIRPKAVPRAGRCTLFVGRSCAG